MDPTFQLRQVRKRPEGVFGKTAFVINITITMNNLYQTQGKRGQDRGGAVPRGRDGHHVGRAWRD